MSEETNETLADKAKAQIDALKPKEGYAVQMDNSIGCVKSSNGNNVISIFKQPKGK